MKFLRYLLLAFAFSALPLALITFADISIVERDLPDLLASTARDVASSPETQAQFAADLGSIWIDENPDIAVQLNNAGLNPEAIMAEAFAELSKTDAFGAELERAAAAYGASLVEGTSPRVSIDLREAIAESGFTFDPAVVDSLDAYTELGPTTLENDDVFKFSGWASKTKQTSGFVALGAALLLLLLTRSARHHFGSLFFVGMPALFLQRFVLQEITNDPDAVGALVGQAMSDVWLPWTHLMMAVSAASLVVFLVSYKLFPKNDFNTVPYAKNSKFVPERPVKVVDPSTSQANGAQHTSPYSWDKDDSYPGLRELSVVED